MGVNVQLHRPRDRAAIRSRGGSGVFLPAQSFPFISTGNLVSAQGNSLTFTRSTTALEFGSNGLLQSYGVNVARFGYNQATLAAKGLLIEAAATQLVTPLASVRDMSDASWVKVTMTATKTATGADGAVNSASTLTATAGTATILQTLVAAGSSRTYSALVKRRTGTGTVLLTHGASTLDITALINSTTYTLVQLNANVLNAAFGFQINTNGDAIDVDYNQFEAGAIATSRIPDTGATRGVELAVIATGAWFNAAQGAFLVEHFNPSVTGGTVTAASFNDTTFPNSMNVLLQSASSLLADIFVGAVSQSSLAGAPTPNTVTKTISMYNTNDFAAYMNSTSLGVDASGTVPTVTRLEVGSRAGALRKIDYYNTRIPNAAAQRLTA